MGEYRYAIVELPPSPYAHDLQEVLAFVFDIGVNLAGCTGEQVAQALGKWMPKTGNNEVVLLMGHGTEHFSNSSYFHKQFKKATGLTPQQFRAQYGR